MTCFSIQKTLFFSALIAGFLAFGTISRAQTESATESDRQKAAEQRHADEIAGKTDAPIVLELFTTSDCTACVMADRMLYDTMIKDKNVIALSCKITDLSEIQQEDILTDEKTPKKQSGPMDPCVFRQWAYKASYATGDVSITIPTFVFNGYDLAGADNQSLYLQMLNSYHYNTRNKALEVFMTWKDKDTITVNLPEDPKAGKIKKSASVWIIRYKDIVVEKVEEGINKDRVLRFSNVIQDIKHIGKWHSQMRSIDVDVPAPQGGTERGGYVVLVQELMGDKVLAAGKLPDYPLPNDKKPAASKETPRTAPAAAAPKQ